MTAQNLPHEPEFEQAYKGMSFLITTVPLRAPPNTPPKTIHGSSGLSRLNNPFPGIFGKWFFGKWLR
jgi:hypothetical protein